MDVSAREEKTTPSDAAEPVSTLNENATSTAVSDKSDATDAQVEETAEAEQDKDASAAIDGGNGAQPEEADKSDAESTPSATTDTASPSKRDEKEPETEKRASSDETPQPKPIKRAAAGSMGKLSVKDHSTTSGAKRTPVAKMPSGTKVSSNSKKFDVIHAKQLAKEPTIYEHDKAKKAKADTLLQSVTRATRSSARKIVSAKAKDEPTGPVAKKIVFKATRNHVSVLDRPTISSSLKRAETKQATKEKAGSAHKGPQPKVAPFTSTVTAGPKMSAPLAASAAATKTGAKAAVDAKPKHSLNYKPYTGPLPKYKEDPIFSPVNKEKIEAAKQPLRSVHTPAKKGKGNVKPAPAKATPSKSTAGRTPIKKASSSAQVTTKAKDDRRAKFIQDSKTNATAARQSPRRAVNAAKA